MCPACCMKQWSPRPMCTIFPSTLMMWGLFPSESFLLSCTFTRNLSSYFLLLLLFFKKVLPHFFRLPHVKFVASSSGYIRVVSNLASKLCRFAFVELQPDVAPAHSSRVLKESVSLFVLHLYEGLFRLHNPACFLTSALAKLKYYCSTRISISIRYISIFST